MISIIIPTKNEEKVINDLLNDLKVQTFKNFEVIVSDADSTDSTTTIVKGYGYKLCKGSIPSIGRNNGSKIAQFNTLLFLDADVRLEQNFIEDLVTQFNSQGVDLAGGYFKIFQGSFQSKLNFLGNNFAKFTRQHTNYPVLTGDMMIIRREVFNNLGGFKPVEIGEDNDLVRRAVGSGYKFKTINISYKSSSRRIESIGLKRLTKVFLLFTYMQITGRVEDEDMQKRIKNIYGTLGN